MTAAGYEKSRRKTRIIKKKFQGEFILTAVFLVLIILNFTIVGAGFLLDFNVLSYGGMISPAVLVFVEILVVAAIWYLTLWQSHKIAGPVYVFERTLRSIEAGDLTQNVRLRKGDKFQETAAIFNSTLGVLNSRIQVMKVKVDELDRQIDQNHPAAKSVRQLKEQLEQFKTG